MSKPITQAQQLADFVVRASYHDLSAQTVSRLKEHVLDTLGCAIGGGLVGAMGEHRRPAGVVEPLGPPIVPPEPTY